MGRNVRYGITSINAEVDATADQPQPTLATDGTAYPKRHDCFEIVLFVTGDGITAGDTCTVRPHWWDDLTARWVRGGTTVVTDDGAVIAYGIGERIYWEVTALSLTGGHFELTQQIINKSA